MDPITGTVNGIYVGPQAVAPNMWQPAPAQTNLPGQTTAMQGNLAPQGTQNPSYNPGAPAGSAGSLAPGSATYSFGTGPVPQYIQSNPNYGGGNFTGASPEESALLSKAGISPIQWNANLSGGNSAMNSDLLARAQQSLSSQTGNDTLPPAPTQPLTSATTDTTGSTQPPPTPGNSSDQYLQDYLKSLQPSPEALATQQQLNSIESQQANLTAGGNLGIQAVGTQPIATPFITGQQAAIEAKTRADIGALGAQAVPLQKQLATQQAMRQSAVDISKAALEYQLKQQEINKPFSVALGAGVYSPATGQTTGGLGGAGGGGKINPATGLSQDATPADILGYLTKNGIIPSRYNFTGYVNAVQNGATAQDIIGGKVNVAGQTSAVTSGSKYEFSPITGLPTQLHPTASSASTGSGTPLASGASGTNVQALQQFLVSKGYMTQADMNTGPGTYGPKTTAAVAAFQRAAGVDTSGGGVGVFGPRTLAAAQAQGYGGGAPGGAQGSQSVTGANAQTPVNLPTPDASKGKATYNIQEAFAKDFTSGGLSDRINAQNTAAGHLVQAYALGQQMHNIDLQGGNALKNWLASEVGKAAVNNYKQAHSLSESELSSAYGQDTGAERALNSAIGGTSSSPAQILGNVQTATALLSSKILSNIQQYKTAYGQDAPLNLNWFVSPASQQALTQVGINFKVSGNSVSIYQIQPDGSAKLIQ